MHEIMGHIGSKTISFSYASVILSKAKRPLLYDNWWDFIMSSAIGIVKGDVSFKLIIK